MDKTLIINTFSIDFVFVEIIKRVLDKSNKKHKINVYSLFSDAKTISKKDNINLMIIDDPIIGASSFELISFLRLQQKIVCPFIYFGVEEYNGERNAILSGANYFFKKPYNPDEVGKVIEKFLLTSSTNLI